MGFREDRPCQQGVIAIAGQTAVGWKVALCVEQAPWSAQSVGMSAHPDEGNVPAK